MIILCIKVIKVKISSTHKVLDVVASVPLLGVGKLIFNIVMAQECSWLECF